MDQDTIDLADPRLDSDGPPAFACGECEQNRAAAELYAFANARLRTRVADLEHGLALALELLDQLEPPIVFRDEAHADDDAFGLLDPPTLVRVLEIVPDPFGVAVAGESSDGASASSATSRGGEVEACGDVVFDGSGHTCNLPPGHGGVHSRIEDGRPVLHWGRSRV